MLVSDIGEDDMLRYCGILAAVMMMMLVVVFGVYFMVPKLIGNALQRCR